MTRTRAVMGWTEVSGVVSGVPPQCRADVGP